MTNLANRGIVDYETGVHVEIIVVPVSRQAKPCYSTHPNLFRAAWSAERTLVWLIFGAPGPVAVLHAVFLNAQAKCGQPPIILQLLLPHNVLPKRELRSHRDPHAVTRAIQYVREKIIANKVGGYTKTKVRSGLPGDPTSEAVKYYRVRAGRLPVQEAADNR